MTCEQIEVTYKIVTPLFCGGAGGNTAEVRLPSFKGVLRWWWRALAWSRCNGDLARIREEEDALFGSAGGGQSKVIMRLQPAPDPGVVRRGTVLQYGNNRVGQGARYLGYGVMEAFGSRATGSQAGELTRPCIDAPREIKLELRARDVDQHQRAGLLDALRALGLLGGLGARSRKGYGSMVLTSMSVDGTVRWTPPASVEALATAISQFVPGADHAAPLPRYTALSPRTRVVLLYGRKDLRALELLDLIGREMMRYRSWGHNGKVLEFDREGNFRDDHDLMKQRPEQRRTHPHRIVFGLPHNYGKKREDQVGPEDREDGDRRASPLLIHIHECGAMPVAVLSFLPAMFLSRGDAAKINVGGQRVPITRDPELWQPIERLLTRVLDPKLRKEPFGGALEVRR